MQTVQGAPGAWVPVASGAGLRPMAGDALGIAIERIEAGLFDDIAALDANYLRRTDAQIFAKPKAVAGAVG